MVRIGVSIDHRFEAGVIHLSVEGCSGGGGSVVGAKAACVSATIAEGIFGGIMK
jgi:hypothetical protein